MRAARALTVALIALAAALGLGLAMTVDADDVRMACAPYSYGCDAYGRPTWGATPSYGFSDHDPAIARRPVSTPTRTTTGRTPGLGRRP